MGILRSILVKKVSSQDDGDAKQKLRVDIGAAEYVIDVLAVTAQLASEPCDSALLATEFLFD